MAHFSWRLCRARAQVVGRLSHTVSAAQNQGKTDYYSLTIPRDRVLWAVMVLRRTE
jgi:hypothetical protein